MGFLDFESPEALKSFVRSSLDYAQPGIPLKDDAVSILDKRQDSTGCLIRYGNINTPNKQHFYGQLINHDFENAVRINKIINVNCANDGVPSAKLPSKKKSGR